jgi:tRNA pseudouridine55 synthase
MNGVLVIDKPAGCTSHDVVARVRRALGESRIGHTGTLDPLATGVLPLVIGRATRLASLLSGADKTYEAGVRFGCATDTFDSTGRIDGDPGSRIASEIDIPTPAGLTEAVIDAALPRFRGTYDQTPPRYSAKKIDGVAAHRLARRNLEVEMRPVTVSVSDLALLGYGEGLAHLRVTASAGFYVRSLAHDLGAALGCGAHLTSLRRTRAGIFGLDDAVALDVVQEERTASAVRILPLERLLPQIPAAELTERGARRASHGNALGPEDLTNPAALAHAPAGSRLRLVNEAGALLGIAEPAAGGLLRPVIVLV